MEKYKTSVAIGFIVLLSILIANILASFVPSLLGAAFRNGFSDFVLKISRVWGLFGYFAMFVCMLYIAFFPRCKSGIVAKIGAIMCCAIIFVWFINSACSMFASRLLIPYRGTIEIVGTLLVYAPGLLMLTWGSKLWMPAKIAVSVSVFLFMVNRLVWLAMPYAYRNSFNNDETVKIFSVLIGIIALLMFIAYVIALILTVICFFKQKKSFVVQD